MEQQEQTIEQLQAELASLGGKVQDDNPNNQTTLDEEASQIPDDDPEVLELVKPHPNPQIEKLISKWCIRTVTEAKRDIAWKRHNARLRATVADESRPMSERVQAAEEWRSDIPKDSRWHQYSREELVERLSVHPHLARLTQLHDLIYQKDERGYVVYDQPIRDVEEYVRTRLDAINEFRRLYEEYPKREGSPTLRPDAEQHVASMARRNDPKHRISRDTYSYVLRLAGFKV